MRFVNGIEEFNQTIMSNHQFAEQFNPFCWVHDLSWFKALIKKDQLCQCEF
jgi:hypothetical protein